MKTQLLLFLLLSNFLFSATDDLFNNLNLETNNKASILSVPPSINKSSTDKSKPFYNAYSLESEFKLNEESKPKFKSYWQNVEDLIFLTKFLNKSVTYRPKIDEEELSFYKTQFNLEVKKLKTTLNDESLEFTTNEDSPLLDEQNNLLKTLETISTKIDDEEFLETEIRELQGFQSLLEKKVYSYNEFLYDDLTDFSLEKDEVIHLVLDDIHAQACVLSIGKDNCPSWVADDVSKKDLQANFYILKKLYGFKDDIEESKKSLLQKTLDFKFKNLLDNLKGDEVYLNYVTKFTNVAIEQLDRNSPKPSIYSRKELDKPDKKQNWKKRVIAVLNKDNSLQTKTTPQLALNQTRVTNAVYHPSSSNSSPRFFRTNASAVSTSSSEPDKKQKIRKTFKDGSVYVGEILNGLPHGDGMLTLPSGTRYIGEFKKGYFDGFGKYLSYTSAYYDGHFKHGLKEGQGSYTAIDGSFYKGDFINDVANGLGILYFSNGSRYEGRFEDGIPNGEGVYFSPEGHSIEGEFKDATIEGNVLVQTNQQIGFDGVVDKDLNPTGEAYFFDSTSDAFINWDDIGKDKESNTTETDEKELDEKIAKFRYHAFGVNNKKCDYEGEWKWARGEKTPHGQGTTTCENYKATGNYDDGKLDGFATEEITNGGNSRSNYTFATGIYKKGSLKKNSYIRYKDGKIYSGDTSGKYPATWNELKNQVPRGHWLTPESSKACERECYNGPVVNRYPHGYGTEIHGFNPSNAYTIKKYVGGFKLQDTKKYYGDFNYPHFGNCQVEFKDGSTYSGTVFPSWAGKYGRGVLTDKNGKVTHNGKIYSDFTPVKKTDKFPNKPEEAKKYKSIAENSVTNIIIDEFKALLDELTLRDALDIGMAFVPFTKIVKLYEATTLINDLRDVYKLINSVGATEAAKTLAITRARSTIVKLVAGGVFTKFGDSFSRLNKSIGKYYKTLKQNNKLSTNSFKKVSGSSKRGRMLPFKDGSRLSEVNKTLDRIRDGGPFLHTKDGTTFNNREGILPIGNYKEYTVDTPGISNRGKRRIVINDQDGKTYYTDDHYVSFSQIDPTEF